jgi:hypothetical protein
MAEHEKEIQELKARVKYLEGVIEGISRGMVSAPRVGYPLPVVPLPMMPTPAHPYWQHPHYTVTC